MRSHFPFKNRVCCCWHISIIFNSNCLSFNNNCNCLVIRHYQSCHSDNFIVNCHSTTFVGLIKEVFIIFAPVFFTRQYCLDIFITFRNSDSHSHSCSFLEQSCFCFNTIKHCHIKCFNNIKNGSSFCFCICLQFINLSFNIESHI